MSIDLSQPNEQFIDSAVATGLFPTRSDAINEAVDLLRKREELRAEIKIGIDQLDRGESEPHNMDDIKEEIRRRLAGKE